MTEKIKIIAFWGVFRESSFKIFVHNCEGMIDRKTKIRPFWGISENVKD